MADTLIVTAEDIMSSGMCLRNGARPWFKAQGLDWTDFILHGIDAEILLAIDDAMAHQVVEVARGRTK